MIPKIIHYCWFGGNPLPPLALKCISSWKKYLPDYEIKEWNENNFDVNIIPYTAEAYRAKKYAFVSDYARFWILYNYGGVYFDTDVEVIRPMDDIIAKGPFMGFETNPSEVEGSTSIKCGVAPGLGIGASKGLNLIKKILNHYESLGFIDDMSKIPTVVENTTKILLDAGLKPISGIQEIEGVYIYPSEYFAPFNVTTKRLHITRNTRSIHRYMDSWEHEKKNAIKEYIRKYLPERLLLLYNRIKH